MLRHRARGLGLPIRSDGFLSVDEVLRTHRLLNLGCTVEEVRWAVQDSSKGRFALGEIEGALMIRATQGHSMGGIVEDQLLQPLTSNTPNLPSEAVHGTYMKYWPSIKVRGLLAGGLRSSRHHVHFQDGWPKSERCLSGMRDDSDVLIYLDIPASLSRGLRLFRSENGVILTPGFDGVVPTELFGLVISIRGGRKLWPEQHGGGGNINLAQSTAPGDPVAIAVEVATDSSAHEVAGSWLVVSPSLAQTSAESPVIATTSTTSGAPPLVPAMVPAADSSLLTTSRPMIVYTAFSNPRGVSGYLNLRVGDKVVAHHIGVTGEEVGWVYGELQPFGPQGWFPALSIRWRDLRKVVRSYYELGEAEGYLSLLAGEQVIVLYTGVSEEAGWLYGERADDSSQQGWFPSMVCPEGKG